MSDVAALTELDRLRVENARLREQLAARDVADDLVGEKPPCRREHHADPGVNAGPFRPKIGRQAEEALLEIWQLHAGNCKDDECCVCGILSCPHAEPLHFHHDGCPTRCGT